MAITDVPRFPDTRSGMLVVVAAPASDAHTWNLLYLQLLLQELGHTVANLGSCVPPDLLVETCRRYRPDLVVIGTVNGHGSHDGMRLIRAIRQDPGLAEIAMVIGGKLGTVGATDAPDSHLTGTLLSAGFAAVFGATDADVDSLCLFVEALALQRTERACHAGR